MKNLTDSQIVDIQRFVEQKMGEKTTLTDELFDHLYILIELEMQAGIPFEAARNKAFSQLDTSVLQDIKKAEIHRKWADKRNGKILLTVIGVLITIGILLFALHLRGFRIVWVFALILTAYIWLPLTAFRR